MNETIKFGSLWVPKDSSLKREIYKVILDSDYEGVVASTVIRMNTNQPDSFIWFSSVEEFLDTFIPVKQ
jgi:hypothetical protein